MREREAPTQGKREELIARWNAVLAADRANAAVDGSESDEDGEDDEDDGDADELSGEDGDVLEDKNDGEPRVTVASLKQVYQYTTA